MFAINELSTCQAADFDHRPGIRGIVRTTRRITQRCWFDQTTINRSRIFCQNSGACGSTYIVRLLKENDIAGTFHEKSPDLMEVGRRHYEKPIPQSKLVRILRYTRHDVFFEANNRMFSVGQELALAFPNARFLYLHRDGTEVVRSAMSKPRIKSYLAEYHGFRGSIAGSPEMDPFSRFCHFWANLNRRIFEDLQSIQSRWNRGFSALRFEDLVEGKVSALEEVLDQELKMKSRAPVNVRPMRSEGRFPAYKDWSSSQKQTFRQVCGPVMSMIGR